MRSSAWVLLCILAACESSSIGNGSPDAPVGSFPDGPTATFDARETCERQTQCGGTQICNPATMRCVASLSCTTHMQCGGEAFCDNGTCAPNVLRGLCDVNENCVGQEHCENGRCGCGGEALPTVSVPPNMLIALDRSGSMDTEVPGTGNSRWEVAVDAIKALTVAQNAAIRFGLSLWPGTNQSCQGGQTQCQGVFSPVTIGGTPAAIGTALDGAGRCGLGTPIAGTLNALAGNADGLGLDDTTRENFVVFVTDGTQNNCTGNEVSAATALRNLTPTVRTFVVGFSGEVDADALNAIAVAGGTARDGTQKYYQADNAATLIAAFNDIAGSAASCDHMLTEPPEDPSRMFVFVGDTQIPRDTTRMNGWDYNPTTMRLTFYGASCATVRGGGDLVVTLGCTIIP